MWLRNTCSASMGIVVCGFGLDVPSTSVPDNRLSLNLDPQNVPPRPNSERPLD